MYREPDRVCRMQALGLPGALVFVHQVQLVVDHHILGLQYLVDPSVGQRAEGVGCDFTKLYYTSEVIPEVK